MFAVVLFLLVAWLAVGYLRGPSIARDYFAQAHGAGVTVTNFTIKGSIPLIPPFWGVSIDGDVTETSGNSYRSAMLLCIVPFTGWVIPCGSG